MLTSVSSSTSSSSSSSSSKPAPSAKFQSRMRRELLLMTTEPPHGVCAWPRDDNDMRVIHAEIEGPEGSPYQDGVFALTINIPDRYPFEPPVTHFTTPVYHPNIDSAGRICLDILKMPPKGCWSPAMNVNAVLAAVRLLLAEPNPDDPLENHIVCADEYKNNRAQFVQNAKDSVRRNAMNGAAVHQNVKKRKTDSDIADNAALAPSSSSAQSSSIPNKAPKLVEQQEP